MYIIFSVFLIEGIICKAFGMSDAPAQTCEIVSLLLIQVNAMLLCWYIVNRYTDYSRKVIFALILSVLLKVFLLLWDYYGTSVYILPNSHLDSEQFHRGGIEFARYFSLKIENYSFVVGAIYYLFGIQRMTAQFFNVILSFLGISVLEKCVCEFGFQQESKEYTMIFAALLPNFLIMSSILIRECLISVILCISLYYFVQWWKTRLTAFFLISFLCVLGACYFHSGSIAMAIGISIALVLTTRGYDGEYRRLNISIKTIILAVAFAFIFIFLFDSLSDSLLKKFRGLELENIESYIEGHNIYESHEDEDSGSSTYTAGISKQGGWQGILINSPIRIIYFLWVPMPWDMRGISDLIAFLGSSMFYGGTFFRAVRLWFRKKEYHDNKALLVSVTIIALLTALVFSWGVDSAGSALRHREKFYFIFLFLYCLVYERSHFTYGLLEIR